MNTVIFDIQRFCIHDGPGIRTTVFFKGCPLKCTWCHNPESQSHKSELAFFKHKCTLCGKCLSVCPVHKIKDGIHFLDKSNCNLCGKCQKVCPSSALEIIGSLHDTEDLLQEALKDKTFYETSGGGITLSGGEPLSQPNACEELLIRAKQEGLNTCVETCGFASEEVILKIAKHTDIFLYDYKLTNPQEHIKHCGVSNDIIISNLKLLNKIGKKIVLRCPIIPTINDNEEHFDGIAKLASELENINKVEIMAFHLLGFDKYDALQKENLLVGYNKMEEAQKNWCVQKISEKIKTLTDRPIIVI